jgi:hypothetical protein
VSLDGVWAEMLAFARDADPVADDGPWGVITAWPEKDRKRKPAPKVEKPDPLRPARRLLRAWWAWDRACRALQREDPETGQRPYPSERSLERQSAEFEDALKGFAVWAGIEQNGLREALASAQRAGRSRMKLGTPEAMRMALAAATGHS